MLSPVACMTPQMEAGHTIPVRNALCVQDKTALDQSRSQLNLHSGQSQSSVYFALFDIFQNPLFVEFRSPQEESSARVLRKSPQEAICLSGLRCTESSGFRLWPWLGCVSVSLPVDSLYLLIASKDFYFKTSQR